VTAPSSGAPDLRPENAALQEVLAAEHAAVWGYGVVGDALPATQRDTAEAAEAAHRDSRDALAELLDSRQADPVAAKAAYALPSPVHSATDAAALAVRLEDGTSRAWVRLLDQAVQSGTRKLAVDGVTACELRAVTWRSAAGQTPLTAPFPGLG
jgi:Domain of unknown function (DUF4439)